MPIYDFSCPACGPFETAHPMSEVPRSGSCPRCGGAARRVFSTAGLSRAGNPAARAIDAAQLGGPGLICVATRRETTVYAEELTERGWRAEAYHAGHNRAERDDVHARFLAGDLDAGVATTAFGMGSHKPNVRFVLHADIPESLDSYYQQIARAGRDGDPAVAVLHYRSEDLGLQRFFGGGASSEQDPRTVFREVRGYRAAESISPKKAVARALEDAAQWCGNCDTCEDATASGDRHGHAVGSSHGVLRIGGVQGAVPGPRRGAGGPARAGRARRRMSR